MLEQYVMRSIMVALSKDPCVRLFRNNTGVGWVGKTFRLNYNSIKIIDAKPLYAGLCNGSSDIIGWKEITITPDMIGKKIAVFTAIEIKSGNKKPSKNQQHFIDIIKNAGGFAGKANSIEEAKEIIKNVL